MLNSIGNSLSLLNIFMKRLNSDKEVDKANARNFAKLTHNCPIVILHYTVDQIKRFRNFIPIIVATLNYCTSFSLDIIVYLVIRNLSKRGAVILREEEGTIKNGFSNISYFLGMLLKKHYKIDLEGIFVFLCNKLGSEDFYDHLYIVILNEILDKMSGYKTFGNFTDIQLDSLSGGIALQTEAFKLTDQVRR